MTKLYNMVERKEVQSMIHGFKNRDITNITEAMREIIVKLERLVGMSLEVGQKVEMGDESLDKINIVIQKFSHREKLKNDKFKFQNADFYVPMATAMAPTEQQTYTKAAFRANIFYGSNYTMPEQVLDTSTNKSFVNLTQQEVFANHSLYISWRDINGNYLNGSNIKGDIEYSIDYSFETFKLTKQKETAITHCVHMSPFYEKSAKDAQP